MEPTQINYEQSLSWVPFFAEMADTLKHYQDRRPDLLTRLREAAEASGRPSLFNLLWTYSKGGARYEADDVDPFTAFAVINRQISLSSKIAVCTGFKQALELKSAVPTGFAGVPQVNNMRSRFESRDADAGNTAFYDNIWALFTAALELATPNNPAIPTESDSPTGNRNEGAFGEYGGSGVER
ncbi:hypothetical protein [Corynebacterium falsenii]|uniref:hypothetical protein n=1 Tax=Corynebacterium falsenii TaxID=108486 RepID=UPI001DCB2D03|nr:hypothetical protein [Corynebacterium falsenii]HJF12149.1 hypothetical protein [Corynebacterium falsenii]